MVTIRPYRASDAGHVGRLIADTYSQFNLSFGSPEELDRLLGPFKHAKSAERSHQEAIAGVISAAMVLVAETDGETDGDIVGVLRGRKERLQSLFVRGDHHRRGIGRDLVVRFERSCEEQGATEIRVAATLFAVPFYHKMGYKKTTGVRSGWSFEGRLEWQPMKKVLFRDS